jgi:peptidoglycan/xylan/chitin deacetylase (PgdA/CDA1 family)
MLAHADLFQIENHGARHLPAVDYPARIYGLAAAGSPAAVIAEVEAGAAAVTAATGRTPQWFRGAAARYSQGALAEIAATGETVAGFSIRADDGATLSAAGVEKRLAAAQDGDVIIAHVNHPEKAAGDGLVKGLLALKARGYLFVKLGAPPRPVAVHQGS